MPINLKIPAVTNTERLIFLLICVSMFFAFQGFHKTDHINIRPYSDFLIVILMAFVRLRWERKTSLFTFLLVLVLLQTMILKIGAGLYDQVGLSNLLISSKLLLYLIFVWIAATSIVQPISLKFTKCIYHFILYSGLVKYVITLSLGLSDRPLLFTENNFELPLLLILFVGLYDSFRNKNLEVVLITTLIIMSKSTSGLLSLVVVYIYIFRGQITFKTFPFLVSSAIGIFGVGFYSKFGQGLDQIDRYLYLLAFINEITMREYASLLFGQFDGLNPSTCKLMINFEGKFDSLGRCFSNVIAIGLVRTILDYGLVGFVVVHMLHFSALMKRFNLHEALAIFSIIFTNSISVSGFYNNMCILGSLILIYTRYFEYAKTVEKA